MIHKNSPPRRGGREGRARQGEASRDAPSEAKAQTGWSERRDVKLCRTDYLGALFVIVFALYFVLFALGLHLAIKQFGWGGLLFAAPLWVSIELLRSILLSGFPWMLSGYALVPYTGILQMAAWTGIYGLSFVAVAVNSLIVYGLMRRSKTSLGVAAAVILTARFLPVMVQKPSTDPIAVRLVQTNISLDQPW